jgi:hypothetical protein
MSIRKGNTVIAGDASQNTYTKSEINSIISGINDVLDTKSNKDLSDLSDEGKNISNWSNNVTNCITKIPQDIKLELDVVTHTVTLKKGSKIWYPNGFEQDGTTLKFSYIITEFDVSITSNTPDTGDITRLIYYNITNNTLVIYTSNSTGTSPASGANQVLYNTNTNKIEIYDNNVKRNADFSFPLGSILGNTNSAYHSFISIFNGFGYIGSTIFCLPGVEGLAPNGFNDDGTYKNVHFIIPKVKIQTRTWSTYNTQGYVYDVTTNTLHIVNYCTELDGRSLLSYTLFYNSEENKTYYTDSDRYNISDSNLKVFLGYLKADGTSAFKGITLPKVNRLPNAYNPHLMMTLFQDNSYIRVWSDGWCEQGGQLTPSADPSNITFLLPFRDTNYFIQLSVQDTSPTDFALTVASWNTKATTYIQVYQGYNGSSQRMPMMWEAKGYIF